MYRSDIGNYSSLGTGEPITRTSERNGNRTNETGTEEAKWEQSPDGNTQKPQPRSPTGAEYSFIPNISGGGGGGRVPFVNRFLNAFFFFPLLFGEGE